MSVVLSASDVPGLDTDALLDVRDVHMRFTRTLGLRRDVIEVLSGVSLALRKNETIGLVGASGVGKSTLARIVAGLIRPTSGSVRVNGVELYEGPTSLYRYARRQVHMVMQDPYDSLAPHMRVRDLVMEPLRLQGMVKSQGVEIVQAALAEVGLPITRFGDRFPHELSGGERQRVALARGLAARPSLIVADEPTSMVDFSVRRELLDLMAQSRQRHDIAFLYVTHDLLLARRFCDRIVVLQAGVIVEDGPSGTVLESPTHPYTVQLVEAARRLSSLSRAQ